MGVHKLTAGDGYTYLTRQVAVHDATDRGHSGLGDYYSEKGESPGRWWGTGLSAVGVAAGEEVTEQQMRNLFGEGRHPNAELLETATLDEGQSVLAAARSARLGRAFAVYRGNAPEFMQEVARRFSSYNAQHGDRWSAPLPAAVRAEIRTRVVDEMFIRNHGRQPLDDRERAGFLAQASRQQTKAVAGYDLTFTPVKSVSTLWALADTEVAKQIADAHHSAVERTLAYLEKEVLFTRRGRGGIEQVQATGALATVFTHRDSRAGDPNIHSHVALSNKVQDAHEGKWLAVDGRVLFKANVTLSEMYNTLVEAELVARLGLRFARRDQPSPGGDRKRAVREVVGVDERVAGAWSRRAAAIDGRRRILAVEFQARHGRPPTAVESIALAQQANLETRQAKHAPRCEADQRATWRSEAASVLGSEKAITEMVCTALGAETRRQGVTTAWVAETARRVVETVESERATWQMWHLRAEAHRRIREAQVALTDIDTAVDRVVSAAMQEHSVALADPDPLTAPGAEPAALTRADGTSVYVQHGSTRFSSRRILEAEQRILRAAVATGGRRISDVRVGIATAEAAANGVVLNAAQQGLVRQMTTSGARLQVALAPAGSGKTTAMGVLTRAWIAGGGTVVGLAPSAVAAEQLRDAIHPATGESGGEPGGEPATTNGAGKTVVCDTLAKLVWSLRPGIQTPDWIEAIGKQSLVLIDEAGMAGTAELADAVDYIVGRGGSVRLIGDDRQLAAVGAGGVLRDIAQQVGAVTLTEVHRFDDAAEAAATLAVREGDPAALGFYADRGRIHVGDLTSAADQAYRAWAADIAEGKDSVLLAPTRELVAELNTRARADRIANNPGPGSDPPILASSVLTVPLSDGTAASVGDLIVTRRNHRGLATSPTDWVKNGDRWTITGVHSDGSLSVTRQRQHPGRRASVRLPSDYVAEHAQLGYACTIHGAQGITVDTSHTVLSGDEDRSLFYVATSRGRSANHIYLNVGSDGDPHNVIRPEVLMPPTAIDELTAILARQDAPNSATTAIRENTAPATRLRDAAARYHDALTFAAQRCLGEATLNRLDTTADMLVTDLTDAPAWPTLRSHLALLALEGHDPFTLLTTAVAFGSLNGARDSAAVIDSRVDDRLTTRLTGDPADHQSGPLPWLPRIPANLAKDLDWGPYLTSRHQQVIDLTTALTNTSDRWNSSTAPAWAQPFLEETDAELRAELTVWRAVNDIPDTDQRPTGSRQIGAPGHQQSSLNQRVRAAHPAYPFAQRTWFQTLPEPVQSDPWITPLCYRLARLERAGLPVADYLTAALSADHERPLPDQHPAAALWWRIVPHLGPTALEGDTHTANLLRPSWGSDLTDLVGARRAEHLRQTPAWPALVAAVDEACRHHAWTPHTILTTSLAGIPTDGTLTGTDVADALVLRIAAITDPPFESDPTTGGPGEPELPEREPPEDLDQAYLDKPPTWLDDVAGTSDPTDLRRTVPEDEVHDGDHPNGSSRDAHGRLWIVAPSTERDLEPEVGFPDPGEVAPSRILELNQAALDYYLDCFPRSWAPDYLRDRIGTDLLDNPTYSAGYAPPGPRSLIRTLTAHGACIEELEQAGLARQRVHRTGQVDYVDVFRDRLVLPILDPHRPQERAIIGFLGRRNPTKSDDDYAGPKYLNTKTTNVFIKGEALFGYAETLPQLDSGALAVLVEGPLDAYAITLGSAGAAVGIAPMGTALTRSQIGLLHRHFIGHPQRVVVATDADTAGWGAAQTAYWNLTAADADPAHLLLPAGLDPASLYQRGGDDAMKAVIASRVPLAHTMIDQHLAGSGSWTEPAHRDELVHRISLVLAARPADTWLEAFASINKLLCLSPGYLEHRVLAHSIERDAGPDSYAQQRVAEIEVQLSPRLRTPRASKVAARTTPSPRRTPTPPGPDRSSSAPGWG